MCGARSASRLRCMPSGCTCSTTHPNGEHRPRRSNRYVTLPALLASKIQLMSEANASHAPALTSRPRYVTGGTAPAEASSSIELTATPRTTEAAGTPRRVAPAAASASTRSTPPAPPRRLACCHGSIRLSDSVTTAAERAIPTANPPNATEASRSRLLTNA